MERHHWHGIAVNGRAQNCLLAHSDFGFGHLRNDAMHVFSEIVVVIWLMKFCG